jgi:hypothetical protein
VNRVHLSPKLFFDGSAPIAVRANSFVVSSDGVVFYYDDKEVGRLDIQSLFHKGGTLSIKDIEILLRGDFSL